MELLRHSQILMVYASYMLLQYIVGGVHNSYRKRMLSRILENLLKGMAEMQLILFQNEL